VIETFETDSNSNNDNDNQEQQQQQQHVTNCFLSTNGYPIIYLPVALARQHKIMPSRQGQKIRVKFINTAAGILIRRDD
jgi:hypothetical protein